MLNPVLNYSTPRPIKIFMGTGEGGGNSSGSGSSNSGLKPGCGSNNMSQCSGNFKPNKGCTGITIGGCENHKNGK